MNVGWIAVGGSMSVGVGVGLVEWVTGWVSCVCVCVCGGGGGGLMLISGSNEWPCVLHTWGNMVG